MGIFDGLPNPAAPAMAFQQGMRQGQAEREEREVKGALSAYATNPDDPAAFATIAQWNPQLAIKIREDQTERTQAAQVADLQRRAAGGDRTAMAELAGIDIEAYDKLSDNERQTATERASVVGQAALRISQLPPEQRPAAWDQSIDQLAARYPELAEYRGQYSEEALMSAIDSAKLVNDFFRLERPQYQVIPEGGTMVDTSNPQAVQAFVGGQPPATTGTGSGQITFEMYKGAVNGLGADGAKAWVQRNNHVIAVGTPAEAQQLPPGTRYTTPDGREFQR